MSRKVEQLQQLLVKIATALQMEDTTDFCSLVDRAEYLCVVEEQSNSLHAQMAGMYTDKDVYDALIAGCYRPESVCANAYRGSCNFKGRKDCLVHHCKDFQLRRKG